MPRTNTPHLTSVPCHVHVPEVPTTSEGPEFDPKTEAHHFAFVVKVVDPGTALEVQIEERDGKVTRVTTTDDARGDRRVIIAAIGEAVDTMLKDWKL